MIHQVFIAVLILLTVGFNTIAQTFLKLGSNQNPLNVYLLGGLVAYGFSTVFYIVALGKLNLSFVYPVVIGLTVIAATIVGSIILREKVSMLQWIGIGLMLSGISAITLGKTS